MKGIAMTPDPGFIRANGNQFALNGQRFRVAGANNYYLGFESDAMVLSVFELAAGMGLNTLRTWAFLDCGIAAPGTMPASAQDGAYFQWQNSTTGKPEVNDGANGLQRLDRTIFLAEQHGIHLILPLVNHWDDFGGVNQYLRWFGLTGRDEFYRHPEVKNAYRNYIEHLLLRVNTRTGRQYRDEPAILSWELANEPRCGNPDTLLEWADEMSSFVRGLDANHLIGVGDEGFFNHSFAFGRKLYNGSFGVDCERLLEIPAIDFGTSHLYPDYASGEAPAEFGARWIREHIEAAERVNKPMLIEEFGYRQEAGGIARDAVFRTWLRQISDNQGAGALLWMIAGDTSNGQRYPDHDRCTVYGPEDAPSVVAFAQGDGM
jgi:mannan endo-1,4-beta-mannosidase